MKKRLRYNNKSSSRIPAVADASRRHLTARSGLEVMLYELLQHALVQKERRNDLPELTPQRARELYEAYRRGEMADVQLMWDQLEERDETLFTVLHARLGALAEMPWAVNIDADLSEDKQALAEQQQKQANKLLAAVENLPEALTHLGMADFRGVAALEIVGDLRSTIYDLRFANNGEPTLAGESEAQATATARASGAAIPQPEAAERSNRQSTIVNRQSPLRWEVIEPWNLCRPVRRGPWYYNAEATSTPTRPEELDPAAVIIREAQPIDLPAMFLICAKYLSVHAWDAFLEVFGIPNIFLEMPPATPQDKALEFDAIVQRLIGEGRGTVPSGAKFHTVETSKDNTQSFEARAKWCNEAIIQLATGGLLTVTAQSGSGTLAGNAHSDSFSRLCAASARSISAAVNRQFLRPALQAAFPHSPMLVSFELAPEPVDDRLQVAQLIATLASAGYRAKEDDVAELMSMQFTAANMNPTDLYATKAVGYVPTMEAMQTRLGMPLKPAPSDNPASTGEPNSQIVNRESPASAKLQRRGDGTIENPAEAGEAPLSADELAALRALGGEINPAQIAADADYMTREMLAGLEEEDEELENRNYARESNGQFAETGAGQHSHKGGRSTGGNPKAKRNKTNIPANLPPNATDGELERRLRKDMDNAAAHKGNQTTKRGDETYATTQKSMDHVREHVDEYLKTHPEKRGGFDTQKMNARAAKIMAQADFDADGKDAIAYGDGLKVVKSKNPKTGETEITTIYPEGKYRKQNK